MWRVRMDLGKGFQGQGATQAKARSPKVFRLDGGVERVRVEEVRRFLAESN